MGAHAAPKNIFIVDCNKIAINYCIHIFTHIIVLLLSVRLLIVVISSYFMASRPASFTSIFLCTFDSPRRDSRACALSSFFRRACCVLLIIVTHRMHHTLAICSAVMRSSPDDVPGIVYRSALPIDHSSFS
jgi:hypothetical protein